jgi:hypothetical protein
MESLLSLFGSGAGGASGASSAGASGGLSYLGGSGASVNPSSIGTPGNGNPNFGPAQGGQSSFGNALTKVAQQQMQGGGGGGGGGGAGGMNASGGYMGGHF